MQTRKTKDIRRDSVKTHISAVLVAEMAADQQALFEKAVDALLADLAQHRDRQTQGELHELE